MGRRRKRRGSSKPMTPERESELYQKSNSYIPNRFRGSAGFIDRKGLADWRKGEDEKGMFERFKSQLGDQKAPNQAVAKPKLNEAKTQQTSTQAGLERLKANRPDFMKPRPMTNQGAMATNMAQAAQGKMMAPEGYKPQQASMPGGQMGSAQPRPGGKGGQSPVGGKGGQRPAPRPNIGMTNSGVPGAGTPPRPQRPMGGGGKGMQRPAGGGFGKGGQRPSPSMGRPNPFSGMSQAQIGAMSENRAQPAPNISVEKIPMPPGADENMAAPMTKKAPAFKMKSGNSTTFKEMGSGKKKSAPVKKTGGGYKMPGFGKR